MRNGSRKRESDAHDAEDAGPSGRFGMEMVAHRSSQARKQIHIWKSSLAYQAKHHPVRSIAVAVGAGYLLGGGLFSRLTGRIVATAVRLGLRLALVPFVTQSIATLGEGLFSDGVESERDDRDDSAGAGSRARQNRSHSDEKETHS
jgi:hypothetical protein